MSGRNDEVEMLRAERDLYLRLLALGAHDDVRAFLEEALETVTDAVGARRGYLALYARRWKPDDTAPADYETAAGMTDADLAAMRSEISGGIIAEALSLGRTIATASAVDDPRFRAMKSVQAQRIQAVICAPIGGREAVGVLYLQGRDTPGAFDDAQRALVETFATRVAPQAEHLLRHTRDEGSSDPTREHRARCKLERLVGRSRALAELFRQVAVAASVDVNVLLSGESGTGKTEVARALHDSSKRAAAPFVEINCAALPESLFEAELFGAEKGAHSTATRKIAGKIAAAEGGTLFLDEIAEVPLAAQSKLLQFLQSKRYFALGADTPTDANVRIVAATNADLGDATRTKRFREDLYYRLAVLALRVPSLRERPDDVPLIASSVAAGLESTHGRAMTLTWGAQAALRHTEWPGNVRQLVAAIQRGAAFAASESTDVIDVRHIFPDTASQPMADGAATQTYQDALRAFQATFLRKAFDDCHGNVSELSRRLDLSRSHLHELLRAHGIARTKTA